jgi:hypothetical protein
MLSCLFCKYASNVSCVQCLIMLGSKLSLLTRRTWLPGHSIQGQSIEGDDEASSSAPTPPSHADHTRQPALAAQSSMCTCILQGENCSCVQTEATVWCYNICTVHSISNWPVLVYFINIFNVFATPCSGDCSCGLALNPLSSCQQHPQGSCAPLLLLYQKLHTRSQQGASLLAASLARRLIGVTPESGDV